MAKRNMTGRLALMIIGLVMTMTSCGKQSEGTPLASTDETNAAVAESHPNVWLEIDTAAFSSNLKYLRQIIGPKHRICVVMKGDAYGNGIGVLMPCVIRQGIEDVAITSNEEARAARRAGYRGRLMRIRLATEEEVKEGIQLQVDELIGNLSQAKYIDSVAQAAGKTIRYQLAVNANGMSRNGIELSKQMADAVQIVKLPHLQCVGMMTHYPENKDGAILQQLHAFQQQTATLISRSGLKRSDLTLSTAATYAALFVPETRMDMVRIGTALYSYGFTDKYKGFRKIMSFKSTVTSVQNYPAGNTVSYKRTHRLQRASRLANIPVGYANGLSTQMANRGYMLIRGHRCPIVGNVTMNITMVDVTDYPDIREGDEVVIYGKQGQAEITAKEIGEWGGQGALEQWMFWSAANPKIAK